MELAIVIPVYNEEKTIKSLIEDFFEILAKENIAYQFIIINDGSTDNSLDILQNLSLTIPNITIFSEKNSGHGPSLYKGYQLGIQHNWIFQIDSDYQYDLFTFTQLWKNREQYDLLIAQRQQRSASPARNFATTLSRYLVEVFYGKGLKDINVPYRLMRATKLSKALHFISRKNFAPNILIAAFFIKNKYRIFTDKAVMKVNTINRKSKMSFYIFRGCIKSIADILLLRFKI